MSFSFTARIDRLIASSILQASDASTSLVTLLQVRFRYNDSERGDSVS